MKTLGLLGILLGFANSFYLEPQSSNTSLSGLSGLSGLNICKNEAPFPVDNYDDCEHKCDEIEACDDFMVMVADYQYHAAYFCELILDEDKCCQHRLLIDEVNDYDECYNYCHTNSKCVDFELDYDGEDTCWHHIDIVSLNLF